MEGHYSATTCDAFAARPSHPQPRRRRSSLLDRWIDEQRSCAQVNKDPGVQAIGTRPNPYMAYPELVAATSRLDLNLHDDRATIRSYDLMDDEDIPDEPEISSTPPPTIPLSHRSSRILLTSSTLRNLNLGFRSVSSPTKAMPPPSSAPPRKAFFNLGSLSGPVSTTKKRLQHKRSSSLNALDNQPKRSASSHPSPSTPSRWRPTVLGHFSSHSQTSVPPSETLCAPSRPSISSNSTLTSATSLTEVDSIVTSTPSPRANYERSFQPSTSSTFCSRSRHGPKSDPYDMSSIMSGGSIGFSASASIMSNGSIGSPVPHGRTPLKERTHARSANGIAADISRSSTPKPLDPNRPLIMHSSKSPTLPRVSMQGMTPKIHRRKRLIISGINPDDTFKYSAAKRWCESHGEVSLITRMPNGDLHVTFRSADVADTVCRLRTKVFIAAVGSVQLSWYTGSSSNSKR